MVKVSKIWIKKYAYAIKGFTDSDYMTLQKFNIGVRPVKGGFKTSLTGKQKLEIEAGKEIEFTITIPDFGDCKVTSWNNETLKLFIWRSECCNECYSDGFMFALAYNVHQARELLTKEIEKNIRSDIVRTLNTLSKDPDEIKQNPYAETVIGSD